jgi:nucleotide-binding universal stress UspA family protein
MSGYKKVLVAVDGSSCSEKAVGVAVNFCRLSNSELHAIFVISDLVVENFKRLGKSQAKEVLESLKDEGRKYFRDVKDTAKDRDVKVVEAIREGFPADEIVTYAKKNKIDLIVMGTHGRRVGTRPLIGSTADRVIHLAPCPILIVP